MSSLQIDPQAAAARHPFASEIKSPPTSQVHVDIPAVLGGAAIATAISWVMTSFGAGIGLAAKPSGDMAGWNAVGLSVATGLWILWIAVSSFAAGGYVSARMRRLTNDSSDHERDLRDGAHGLMVWAVGLLALAWLASPAFSGLEKAATAATAATAVARSTADGDAHAVDRLTRGGASATTNEAGFRDDMRRSLTLAAAEGSMSPDDKSYLTQQIAAREGIAPADAEKRIDQAVGALVAAANKAREAATAARHAGIILAFLTGASLLIGAAAAWWAASMGGRHRDQQVDFAHLTTWR